MKDIIVVGGGAGGMMAAIKAAEEGNKVTLIERNEKLGKKVFITGKGRWQDKLLRERLNISL